MLTEVCNYFRLTPYFGIIPNNDPYRKCPHRISIDSADRWCFPNCSAVVS